MKRLLIIILLASWMAASAQVNSVGSFWRVEDSSMKFGKDLPPGFLVRIKGDGWYTVEDSVRRTVVVQTAIDSGWIVKDPGLYIESDPISFHKADSNTAGNAVTLDYFNDNLPAEGVTPADGLLDWDGSKYGPYAAKKTPDPAYAYFYSGNLPTYSNQVALDGWLYVTRISAGCGLCGQPAILGSSYTSSGVSGESTSGVGVAASSHTGNALRSYVYPSAGNTMREMSQWINQPTVSVGAGLGGYHSYKAKSSSGAIGDIARFGFKATRIVAGSMSGSLEWSVAKSGPLTKRMELDSNGRLSLSAYGAGAITGTGLYSLQSDASGNIIEGTIGGEYSAGYGLGLTGSQFYNSRYQKDIDTVKSENAGLLKVDANGVLSGITDNSANWEAAYGWGNHASAGYVTGTPWTAMGYLTTETDPTAEPAINAGTTSQYWRGDKTWQTLPTYVNSRWTLNGSDIYFNTGSVGIGTSSPVTLLDVAGSGSVTGLEVRQPADSIPVKIYDKDGAITGEIRATVAGAWNTFFGRQAGEYTIASVDDYEGMNNTAVGTAALEGNSTGNQNVAVGAGALLAAPISSDNIAIGFSAMGNGEIGGRNIAIGTEALQTAGSNATDNIAIGHNALYSKTNWHSNIAIGSSGQYNAANAYGNCSLGTESLYTTLYSYNLAIGNWAGKNSYCYKKFFLNNIDQGSEANDSSYSLLYGQFAESAGSKTNQWMKINGTLGVNTPIAAGVDLNVAGLTKVGSLQVGSYTVSGAPESMYWIGVDTTAIDTASRFFIGYSNGIIVDSLIFHQERRAGSPDVTAKIFYGSDLNSTGTAVITAGTQVTTYAGATRTGTINNATVAKGNAIWMRFSAVSVKPKGFYITIIGHKI